MGQKFFDIGIFCMVLSYEYRKCSHGMLHPTYPLKEGVSLPRWSMYYVIEEH